MTLEFETRVYNKLKTALEEERLGLLPTSCEMFHQKGYFSRDRGAEIKIDVSIEVTLTGCDQWSLLWAWECKHYSGSVPVDDVEEFWAKLQQIGGANIKGGLATTSALQKSALAFAKSKGITVVRFAEQRESFQFVLHHDYLCQSLRRWLYDRPIQSWLEKWIIHRSLRATRSPRGREHLILDGREAFGGFGSMLKHTIASKVSAHLPPPEGPRHARDNAGP